MQAMYMMIQNPGVAPKESFTLLGASTKKGASGGVIGQFGSGNKHGVSVCLRHKLEPVVFAGNLKMTFGTRDQNVNDGNKDTNFERVFVKYSGKEGEVNRSATEDLGFVLDYGSQDWSGVELALREFISNAIDRAIEEGQNKFYRNYVREVMDNEHHPSWNESQKQDYFKALREYGETAMDFKDVEIQLVAENQVRAKSGCTRVFVPMNDDVFKFYNNVGKWFLHFSEPENLNKTILPKKNRNLVDGVQRAVIYRRGVRVREFESSDLPSLFDYNLNNLKMDESRTVDDWNVRQAAALVFRDASKEIVAQLINCFFNNKKVWEYEFDAFGLKPSFNDSEESKKKRQTVWMEAMNSVCGEDSILACSGQGEMALRKGYKVVTAPEAFVIAAGQYGLRTPEKILSQDDRDGREILEPTAEAVTALNYMWEMVESVGMTNGKEKPYVKCFTQMMNAGMVVSGFQRDTGVYINLDIAGNTTTEGKDLSNKLKVVMLEEIAHHVTGATDNSRDFQDFAFNLAIKFANK